MVTLDVLRYEPDNFLMDAISIHLFLINFKKIDFLKLIKTKTHRCCVSRNRYVRLRSMSKYEKDYTRLLLRFRQL